MNTLPDKNASVYINKAFQSIGKEFFVEHLTQLQTNTKTQDLAQILHQQTGKTLESCLSRTKKARTLLKRYPLPELLQAVIDSKRVKKSVLEATQTHLQTLGNITRNQPRKTTTTKYAMPIAATDNNKTPLNRSQKLKYIKRRSISLLPNFFTLVGLFFGFLSIVMSMQGQPMQAMYCIAVAAFFDGVDGKVARLTNTFSRLGVELDSIADMVSFGIAPAIFLLSGGLDQLGNIGWAICFLYVATAALRLARFNSLATNNGQHKSHFLGLPSPAAAGVVVLTYIMLYHLDFPASDQQRIILVAIVTALVAVSMVSSLSYTGLTLIFAPLRPFWTGVIIVVLLALMISQPLVFPSLILLGYWLSAPVIWLLRYTNLINKNSFT